MYGFAKVGVNRSKKGGGRNKRAAGLGMHGTMFDVGARGCGRNEEGLVGFTDHPTHRLERRGEESQNV